MPAGSGSKKMKTSKRWLLGCLFVGMLGLSACGGGYYDGYGGGGVIIGGPIELPDAPVAVPFDF
jgi:hypothetical protein